MEVIPLFSVPLAVWEVPIPRELILFAHQELKNDNIHFNVANDIGNNKNILDRPEFLDLRSEMQNKVNEFYEKVLNIDPSYVTGKIGQSWLTYTKPNSDQKLHEHRHLNAFTSGVFYLQTSNEDYLEFTNPINEVHRHFRFMLGPNHNRFNSRKSRIPTPVGTLIMFPSLIAHQFGEPETPRKDVRISMGFDTFFKGELTFGPEDYSKTFVS